MRGYGVLCCDRFTNAVEQPQHTKVPVFAKIVRIEAQLGAFFTKQELESIGYNPTDNKATNQFFDWLAQPHLNRGNFAAEVRLKHLEEQVKQLTQSKVELE